MRARHSLLRTRHSHDRSETRAHILPARAPSHTRPRTQSLRAHATHALRDDHVLIVLTDTASWRHAPDGRRASTHNCTQYNAPHPSPRHMASTVVARGGGARAAPLIPSQHDTGMKTQTRSRPSQGRPSVPTRRTRRAPATKLEAAADSVRRRTQPRRGLRRRHWTSAPTSCSPSARSKWR